jgi:streptomycin 6-kinase
VTCIPAVVRTKAMALDADEWLPELVADVAAEWSLSVGRTFEDATEALVAEATLEDGTAAVLKLPIPGRSDAVRHELTALRLAAGEGCARLLRSDESRSVLLLERLGRARWLAARTGLDAAAREQLSEHLAAAAELERDVRPAPRM